MAGRGESCAADPRFPEHWRDVRDWSIEKRQNHKVRAFLHTAAGTLCRQLFSEQNELLCVCFFLSVQSILRRSAFSATLLI